MSAHDLSERHCTPLRGVEHRLDDARTAELLAQLPGWALVDGQISKTFQFTDYAQTLAFANGVAWMAERENHHPEMVIGFNRCRVAYSTHDVRGLSLNDFICAAKIEALRGL
ncbi:MAG: 4a-hydroxytetrahydrobiopterin dehydratase [Betaproteobacteria bacterium]|nr:4a-hydroxytetrahydrobiopterin dehydratase [Rhodocyclaceae bacterium]